MKWDRSIAIGIANAACTICGGLGIVLDRSEEERACECVFRAAFRSCYQGFVECLALAERTASVSWEPCSGPKGGRTFSRKREEYVVDFLNVTEQNLDPEDYRLFRYHFLLGADCNACCEKLHMDPNKYFYSLYRIESQLGCALAEIEPYPLYPLRE